MDIVGKSDCQFVAKDSNPGKVTLSPGGVARNIAENLNLLDIPVKFLSAVGKDLYGDQLLSHLSEQAIDIHYIKRSNSFPTSTYLSVLDDDGDMQVAISDMSISSTIDIPYLQEHTRLIQNSALVVLDTNLDEDVLTFLFHTFKNTKFIVDTVSTTKSKKLIGHLNNLYAVKPNRLEAEILTGFPLTSHDLITKGLQTLKDKGVIHPMISLGKDGIATLINNKLRFFVPRDTHVINANGAGDAFSAALTYGFYHNKPLEEIIPFAVTASSLAIESYDTVNRSLSVDLIKTRLKEK